MPEFPCLSAVDVEHPVQHQPPVGHPHRRAMLTAVEDDELDRIARPELLDGLEEPVMQLPADDLVLVAMADVDRDRMRILIRRRPADKAVPGRRAKEKDAAEMRRDCRVVEQAPAN